MPNLPRQSRRVDSNFAGAKKPSITGATRLETQPTVGRVCKTGLQAPLADPLWLLARQWQFNEFQGEDAGTPLKIAVRGRRHARSTRFAPDRRSSSSPWQPLESGTAPLETRVEAEPVWKTHPRLRGEAGLQALRMAPAPRARGLARRLSADARPAGRPRCQRRSGGPPVVDALQSSGRSTRRQLADDLLPLLDADGTLTALPAAIVARRRRRRPRAATCSGAGWRGSARSPTRATRRISPRGSAIAWSTRSALEAGDLALRPTSTPTATSTGTIFARSRSRRPGRGRLRRAASPSRRAIRRR